MDKSKFKKKVLSIYIIFLLGTGGFIGFITFDGLINDNGVEAAKTIIVDCKGGGNYTSIQTAINNANKNDVIRIWAGTYNESLTISKSLKLIGNGSSNTTIRGGVSGIVVQVKASYVEISGFTITNGSSYGVGLNDVSYCKIYKNNCSSNSLNGIAIYGTGYQFNDIYENDCTNNNNHGIEISSHYNDVYDNNCSNNKKNGIDSMGNFDNTIQNNICNSNEIGISVSNSGEEMFGGDYIYDNTCHSNSRFGIELSSSYYCWVQGNYVKSNPIGMKIDGWNHRIIGNTMLSNSNYGLEIDGTSIEIYHNNFIFNKCMNKYTYLSWNKSYPTGGNYWSDYKGKDLKKGPAQSISGSDGIGDTPHTINSALNKDIYPLMTPYGNFKIAPSCPRNLQTKVGDSYINISWKIPEYNGGTDITHYKIYRGLQSKNETFFTNVSSNFTYYNDTTITNGLRYYYYLTAVNSLGESDLSDEIEEAFSILPGSPDILITTWGDEYINLTWSEPTYDGGADIISYKLYRGINSSNRSYLGSLDKEIRFFNDTSVINGITYYYNITAINKIGESNTSIEINSTPLGISDAPEKLVVTTGDNYVNLTWAEPMDNGGTEITEYKIYRSLYSKFETYYDSVNGSKTYFNDTSVSNGITYFYYLTALNCINESISCDEINATPLSIPGAPHDFGSNSGDGFINISWSPPNDNGGTEILEYEIYRGLQSGDEVYLATGQANEHFYNDTSVINGNRYYYFITAKNIVGNSYSSNEISAVPLGKPSQPIELSIEFGNNFVNLSWQLPLDNGGTDIINFNIFRGTIKNKELFLTSTIGIKHYYNDTNVQNGQIYYYRISALNIIGEGLKSEDINTMPLTVPSPPQNVLITSGNSFLTLTWSKPEANGGSPITNYSIYRDTSPGAEAFYEIIGNIKEYIDNSVTNGVTYYYKLRAVNAEVGVGIFSEEVSAAPATIPLKPRDLKSTAGNSYINLSWQPPNNDGGFPITNYKIFKGTNSGGEIFLTEIGNILYFNDTDVINGKDYFFKVRAKNNVGDGPLSDDIVNTPGTTPYAPLNLQIITRNSFIKVTWEAPTSNGGFPIIGYRIYRDTTHKLNVLHDEVESFINYFLDLNVTNGVQYYYRITAINILGEGMSSENLNGIPTNQPPIVNLSANRTSGVCPLTISFVGSGSDPDGHIDSYLWDFKDGNTTHEQNPTHTFQKPGNFSVSLSLTDNDGTTVLGSIIITVFQTPDQNQTIPVNETEKNETKTNDRDGDGVIDSKDVYPLDPTRWQKKATEKFRSNIDLSWLWLLIIIVVLAIIVIGIIIMNVKKQEKIKSKRRIQYKKKRSKIGVKKGSRKKVQREQEKNEELSENIEWEY